MEGVGNMGGITSEYINFMAPKFVSEEAETYMQQSMLEIQKEQSQSDNNPWKMLSTNAAQIKDYEQVDPYTLDIIAKLFPSGGLEFLALILRHATIKQATLPEVGKIGEYVAIISTRTLRTLASTIKWGYDTTHKYVTVFCALNLIRKIKHHKELQIIFPLGKYQPPQNLHAIDSLITKSRPKVQQFTRKVKERFLSLNLLSSLHPHPNEALALSKCDPKLQQTFIDPMLEIIKSEGIDPAKGQHIVFRLVSEVLGKLLFPKLFTAIAEQQNPTMTTIETQADTYHYQNSTNIEQQLYNQPESTRSTNIQAKVRPNQQKVYLEGRLSPENKTNSQEKSTKLEKYPVTEQKVYPQQQKESTLRPLAVDSVLELLYTYSDLLDDPTVDWEQMGLPKDFFEDLYAQIYTYYTRMHNKGLLVNTRGHMWRSVEVSIIKKLATTYGVDGIAACTYIFQCTGREYQPPVVQPVKVYPTEAPQPKKRPSRDQLPEDWYQPPDNRDEQEVDLQQQKVDLQMTTVDAAPQKSTAQKTFSDSCKVEYLANNQQIEKSTSAVDFSKTDSEKSKKVLRMPVQLDLEIYGEEFYNVIRKRNINILFNNIYNNVTLRSKAAKFLARLFDNKDSEKVCKLNENLLKKYKPEVITTAFIDTILSMHEPGYDSLQNPGAYFTSRCKYYQNQEADEETQHLVKFYSSMNYDELVAEMKIVIDSEKKLRTKTYRGKTQF
ncbi:hypothetical protein [Dictyobacter formicarum]|uniref:Uncharacterized protein n=1 Tax=Dictyobacter formicarum TaxID=2778368 RepID=A0ABQ3VLZ8_9CHLR|nr:hypothetical protein [Dictyobacter formicarum]GHO86411.1 hypothetical protein KSZ_44170 [Dictyobacter formicarum]